ncbi:S1/P1 nuclease [Roseateles violae]|uniref:S1/P1 nuclease n=1 Tax=Roseateles violae TaxID=3058042 RepID=A0ABT8DRP9_9BURK|nr:S1/P1 nuclease [Pelomonas sp. PFR6]MDN3918974.1 S1/P1 nuclease [Pelomonas sp. PFR6]
MSRPVQPRLLGALVAALALLGPLQAGAWGFEGHRLIAALAEAQLSPAARAEARRLLALEPGATLSSISTWADVHRSPRSGRWHYINFPEGDCSYRPARDCADGACVVEALNRQTALLASAAGDAERLLALKYVVHMVGDVHQPLHAGHGSDKGGNRLQLQAFGRGSNLHALWDSGLIMNREGGPQALRAALAPALQGEARPQAPAAAAWALESCRIVEAPDFYPAARHVGAEYRDAQQPRLDARLKAAAQRLAATLNEALKPQ